MSGQSYSHYMRPQDGDGIGSNHASGRGRSPHLASSRGRSRERSYDRMSHHERDMSGEARRDQYHRSRSSDYAPHSRSLRRCSDADTTNKCLSRAKDASILSWPTIMGH